MTIHPAAVSARRSIHPRRTWPLSWRISTGCSTSKRRRIEARVEHCPQAPCTPYCVGGRHGAFVGQCRDESRSAFQGVVAVRVQKLRGDHRMECRADSGHVLAMDRNSWSSIEYLSHDGALDRLRIGRAQPLAEWGLDWLSLVEPRGCEPIRGGLGWLGIGDGASD